MTFVTTVTCYLYRSLSSYIYHNLKHCFVLLKNSHAQFEKLQSPDNLLWHIIRSISAWGNHQDLPTHWSIHL